MIATFVMFEIKLVRHFLPMDGGNCQIAFLTVQQAPPNLWKNQHIHSHSWFTSLEFCSFGSPAFICMTRQSARFEPAPILTEVYTIDAIDPMS